MKPQLEGREKSIEICQEGSFGKYLKNLLLILIRSIQLKAFSIHVLRKPQLEDREKSIEILVTGQFPQKKEKIKLKKPSLSYPNLA